MVFLLKCIHVVTLKGLQYFLALVSGYMFIYRYQTISICDKVMVILIITISHFSPQQLCLTKLQNTTRAKIFW